MDNKGLKIVVGFLAVMFAACVAIAIIYKDDMAYKKAKKAGTKDAYAIFVQEHPKSEYYQAAKHSLDSITAIETERAMQTEYDRIRRNGNIDAYLNFLRNYPDSEHAGEVQSMIETWDEQAYQELRVNYNSSNAEFYLESLPNGKHAAEVREMKWAHDEEDVYKRALSLNTVAGYQNYIDNYPKGKHLKEMVSKKAVAQEQEDYETTIRNGNANAYRNYLANYPNGKHRSEIRGLLDEIEAYDTYKDNSLANGSQPYSAYYGTNKPCSYYGCSEICVKAPHSSDVLVLIKKENSEGKVVRHGYVKGGCQVCFEVPDGRYQTFFYYGKGWYPKKQMQGGVKGGFLRDELFSKDNPQYLDGQILTYELILQQNGNFSTKPSSESEMF